MPVSCKCLEFRRIGIGIAAESDTGILFVTVVLFLERMSLLYIPVMEIPNHKYLDANEFQASLYADPFFRTTHRREYHRVSLSSATNPPA